MTYGIETKLANGTTTASQSLPGGRIFVGVINRPADNTAGLVSTYSYPLIPGGDKSDSNHRTYPFLTNFEKTKIIGLRSNQLSKGSIPFIAVPKHITDVRDIARLELEQKRLPFIIKRPLPNETFEYWRLVDLLIL